jgi:putative membrane protein
MVVEAPPRVAVPVVPALLGSAVLAQIAYPLVSGEARDVLTIGIVVLVASASFAHAWSTRGPVLAAGLCAVTALGGFGVELVGVHTGVPFGAYTYADSLGTKLLGVPVVIALAWPMLAWPAALAARRLGRSFPARVLIGGWALASWDLFLDPQMVAAGHWTWTDPSPHLPGVGAVPLSDYAGWLLVSLAISYALQGLLRDADDGDDRWPLAFYVWTWASSTLALAVFLGLPAAAAWGAVGMGTVAVPVARSLAGRR